MILKFWKRLFPAKSHIHTWFILLLPPAFSVFSPANIFIVLLVGLQERPVKARLQLDVLASTHVGHRLRSKDVLPGWADLHMPTTQLYPGYLPAEQGHNTTVSWPRAGTADAGIHQSLLWTTQTSALRLSSSTWLNYLQAEHPTGRDQVKTGRGVVLWHLSTPLKTPLLHISKGQLCGAEQKADLLQSCDNTSQENTGGLSPKRKTEKTFSKCKSLFCPLLSRLIFSVWPTSQIFQRFLQAKNWLTWARGRHSPDTTGRIYSSVCVAAPLGLQHWKHRQFVENKAVNRREGNNEDWPGGLREIMWLSAITHSPM